MDKIRIAIVGYGNVGKGVELAVKQNPDMILGGIFTRRPESVMKYPHDSSVFHINEARVRADDFDVAVLCGGSATDLPVQGPQFAEMFNTVDSYDTHAKIPEYFEAMDRASRNSGKLSIISTGWDPGLFSLLRVLGEVALPEGQHYTFWGPGVSQGHSDAVRRIDGVKDARQYTFPVEEAVNRVRQRGNPELTTREKHRRLCYVVAEEGADLAEIERQIVTMPNYFADNETEVRFISMEEMTRDHSDMPHGGFVLRSGRTGTYKQLMEFGVTLDNNPGFTGSVMTAYARAAYRLNKEGQTGAKTVFDIAPAYLSIKPPEELRRGLL